jgi:cell division protein FtsW
MSITFARTDTSLLSRWWWTVDRWMVAAIILLAALGIVLTMAASPAVAERLNQFDAFYFARRQAAYIPAALAIMLATSLLSPKGVLRSALIMLLVAFVATVATLFVGDQQNGATRWVYVGGISVQPSEFLKAAFAVISAWTIARSRIGDDFVGYVLATLLLAAVATVLVLQPDVGTTILVCGTWCLQIFLAGCPLVLIALIGMALVAGGFGAYAMFDHVRSRVDQFLDPASGEGYQVRRALEAFHTGGLFGRGPGEGHVKAGLPDAHADFIFAVAGEEFGLLLCLVLVFLFGFIVLRGFVRAFKDSDLFVMLAGGGLLALFGMQALMNMASAMHLIPPKGITLPFISYGGSATIAVAWSMGMALALTRDRPDPGGRR